ncbi:MAG: bifunctional diaminohydroxyphosphoribosylaminopyrimidine deaminase/5-amino-6-(5-phosphoribosylamino)uracil reductase RibD [Proteobacteria bacterium]|nr:bifunctional diaminohydroxyphosphoribosylaminopyrimidine deaminase/5-amino-6-(5-phosphoribosylamino)uracil reductase RibD [Pseudomonadota bacterium]
MNEDHKLLLEALNLAGQRKGHTHPNPAVGAVVVKDGKVLGRGFHWGAGSPHAEVEALKNLESEATGATLYVTLEPCCHFGKTPPCTGLLKEKKLKRVVYGLVDPNPIVAGKGAEILRRSGILVEHLPLPELQTFYESYVWWTQTRKTWLTGKLAVSRDGKVCSSDGSPIKITGALADNLTHFRRSQADVILTSIATLRADNPRMDVRLGSHSIKKPVWVLDRELSFSMDYQLMKTAQSVILVHGKSASEKRKRELKNAGLECVELSEESDQLVLTELAYKLGERGLHEAWCEFGPILFSTFARNKLFQEVVLYRSLQVEIQEGREAFPLGKNQVLESYRKTNDDKLGSDIKERWVFK